MSKFTPNNIHFSVAVLDQLDGHKLKTLKADEHGYFTIPVAVIGATSRNRAFYEVQSLVDQIKNPNSYFNMMLREGNLRGEYGHPPIDADLARIQNIFEPKVSHHIRRVYTGESTDKGTIIYAEIKPCGPQGKYLLEHILNPNENTTFSLRCLMQPMASTTPGVQNRMVRQLVTFDYVNMPGYKEASKWYAPAQENFVLCDVPLTMDKVYNSSTGKFIGCENWSDDQIHDIFGIKTVDLSGEHLSNYIPGSLTYKDDSGINRSVLQSILER